MIIPLIIILLFLLFMALIIPSASVIAHYLQSTLGGNAIYLVTITLGILSGIFLQYIIEIIYGEEKIYRETKIEKIGKILIKQPEMMGTVIGAILIFIAKLIRLLKNIKQKILSIFFIYNYR